MNTTEAARLLGQAANPHARALGQLGRGKPKTMTRAAKKQRKLAAKQPRPRKINSHANESESDKIAENKV